MKHANIFIGNAVSLFTKIRNNSAFAAVYACGPRPMLKSLVEYTQSTNLSAQISMEENMACGIGSCIGCIVPVIENGETAYKRVCKDGPVFDAGQVVL